MAQSFASPASFRSQGRGDLARVGVAVCHGFTGSPVSMRAWSEHLADAGFAVNMPLLAGHGTSWQELSKTPWEHWYRDFEAAYLELAARCDTVFVAGMSMGGALALRVAALHPVAGIAVVNPGLTFDDPRAKYSGLLKHVIKSVPAIGDDIKVPGISEGAYTRTPVAAVHELSQLFTDTISLLPRITAPTVVFRSTVDHVVPDSSLEILQQRIGSTDVQVISLENSYHVATVDNDAPLIFSESADFFRRNLHAI
ncbi:carboxylesterase [Arthrobacter sp. PAMC 25486]|uniref:alpha/beta hydrolase n=1 Tax=Arthrobacter sp. PAMC 25486 TaxID=1494608 RepID=UPI000535BAB9|nr:alpha/beta fold hydrolase [Arthrobacter sp. PAMC 25486]AIX99694.1 carboxylesterase [Arthrobacter sp. PAMC 25486]